MTRIVIADDFPVVREGIRRVLERVPGFEIVAESGDTLALPDLVRSAKADLVLLDLKMPGPAFSTIIQNVLAAAPQVRILVISALPEERFAVQALRSGAHGYLEKSFSVEGLTEAVRRVVSGKRYISPDLADQLADARVSDTATRPLTALLSTREFEVLTLLAQGLGLKEAGARLQVNPKTISSYRARLLAKLGVTSTAELVRVAVEAGLIGVASA